VFETTEIEVGGFNSGTSAPEGIGQVKCLRPLLYGELDLAYGNRKLDELMRSLDGGASAAVQGTAHIRLGNGPGLPYPL
jgi:hypothetical protein